MRDFIHIHNSNPKDKRFSLENRLVWADTTGTETLSESGDQWEESARLDYISEYIDDFGTISLLSELPETENEMVKFHLARNIAQTDKDLDAFFENSEGALGFKIEDGEFIIEGADTAYDNEDLADYLNKYLIAHADEAGFDNTEETDISPDKLAEQVVGEAQTAKRHYDFLENYGSIDEFKEDYEKTVTLRMMAEARRDYESQKATMLTRSKVSEETLAFETRVDLVRDRAANITEAALLWYAINYNPKMEYESLDLNEIFAPENIEDNGIAIVDGRLVVAYKPADRELPRGVEYEYATYGYTSDDPSNAIRKLADPNNKYSKGKKGEDIAAVLRDGIEIYGGILDDTDEMIGSYETNEVFQENYELLQRIMWIPAGMLNDEIGLEDIDTVPEFTEENGPWYFGHIDGKFYARNIHPIEKGDCYVFDAEEGWVKTDKVPVMEYAIPEFYSEQKDGSWKPNKKAIEMISTLGLSPDYVLVRTLNVLHGETRGDERARTKLLDAFAFDPIPGLTIPFPQLEDVEILLDTQQHRADSLTNIQDYLHTNYIQRFPGIDFHAAHWLAGEIGERFLDGLFLKDQAGNPYVTDQYGNPIEEENKYILSSGSAVANFTDAFRPQVQWTAEKQFSEETQARIDQIHSYIEGTMNAVFGAIGGFLSKWGVLGEFANEFIKEYTTRPLGDIWELSEELAMEWEALEKEKGTSLTFKSFLASYAAKGMVAIQRGEVEEGSFLHRLMLMLKPKDPTATDTPQGRPRTNPELTAYDLATQLQAMDSHIDPSKKMFDTTDDEIATRMQEFLKRYEGETFPASQLPAIMEAAAKYILGDAKYREETEAFQKRQEEEQRRQADAAAAAQEQDEDDTERGYEALSEIEFGKPYNGKYEVTEEIMIPDGRLKVRKIEEVGRFSRMIIEYSDGSKDRIEHRVIAEELLRNNNETLQIGKKINRVEESEPVPIDQDYTISESSSAIASITFETGVQLKDIKLEHT